MAQGLGFSIPMYSLYGQIDGTVALRFLHLETLEARNRVYGWNIRPHRHHDLHQLVWVADGHGRVMLDDQSWELHSPVLISIPQTVVHGFQWVPGAQGLVLTLSASFVADILGLSEDPLVSASLQRLLAITGALDDPTVARLHGLFSAITDEYAHERVGRITAVAGHVTLLFAELTRLRHLNIQPEGVPRGDNTRAACRSFLALVEDHFREHMPIAQYAAWLSVPERRLRQTCLDGLGLTPLQVVQLRLFTEAKRDLLYTDQTIAEVGYALGFEDPAYFARFFVRHEGDTPRAFRRKRRARGA